MPAGTSSWTWTAGSWRSRRPSLGERPAHRTVDQLGAANRSGQAEELTKKHTISLVVDLFERPKRVRYAREVYELVLGGATIAEAAHRLGLAENTANRAGRLGALLAERGLDDPYVELKAMPKRPGRWKHKSNRPDVFDAAPH